LSSVHVLIHNVIENCAHCSVPLLILYLTQFSVVHFASNNVLYSVDLPFCSLVYILQTFVCVCVCVCVCMCTYMCTCMHVSASDWMMLFRAMFPKLFSHALLVVLEVLHETSGEKWKLIWNYWGGGCCGVYSNFALTRCLFQIPARFWGILACLFVVFLTPSRSLSG